MEVVMKELKTVEELIHSKNLTAEELELHKELIEECRAREARIAEYSRIAQANLEKLSQSLTTLKQRAVVLGDALKVLQERADNLYLKLLPEEIFYRE
jgi:cell division protein FtsB